MVAAFPDQSLTLEATNDSRDMVVGSDVRVSTVIDFPHGNSVTAVKVAETSTALQTANLINLAKTSASS